MSQSDCTGRRWGPFAARYAICHVRRVLEVGCGKGSQHDPVIPANFASGVPGVDLAPLDALTQ